MNDTNPNPVRNPKGALAFRIFAIGAILYFLADLILAYVKGGEGAPTPALILVATVILGGGAILVGILTWKAWKEETKKDEGP